MSNINKPLIFIDTNIYLDFYRARNEKDIALLQKVEALGDRLISTYQVEMEFKKNRQMVIRDSLNRMKSIQHIDPPGFLLNSQDSKQLKKNIAEANKRIDRVKTRVKKVFKEPTKNDLVYKIVQRIFKSSNQCNLTRTNKIRHEIRDLARKRFELGYPPRKEAALSFGDSINWEWIVACGEEYMNDVIIVSRDSDFGITLDGTSFINDWLLQEYRARVSKKRKVVLVDRLSKALKQAKVNVTTKEEKGEEEMISSFSVNLDGLDMEKFRKQLDESTKAFREALKAIGKQAD